MIVFELWVWFAGFIIGVLLMITIYGIKGDK